eukprot:CAMPEP_0198212324 /NCGR_PEP_ID=MMETSP1445-20131203/25651_1 /TAXON_ID=36898 /ORGANISM="Pyramimonas sp., Strain CCMP2087" /LENGTH=342 /DNA_ID=CAMNT_0043886743 /DNA_START=54 /DNA_END=1082 /DNA_ORIENTATION=+
MSTAHSLSACTAKNACFRASVAPHHLKIRASKGRALRVTRLECVSAVKFASKSKEGKRGEDASFITQEGDLTFLGVYDGRNGASAAQYLKENFYANLTEEMKSAPPAKALVSAYLATDKTMCTSTPPGPFGMFKARGIGGPRCAATAVTALVMGDTIVVANVGDCKALAIKGEEVTLLTEDHSGGNKDERQRIQTAILATLKEKGDISAKIGTKDPSKVFRFDTDVTPGTGFTWQLVQAGTSFPVGSAVTRSMGDAFLKPSDQLPQGYGMIASPFVSAPLPLADATWLVLASAPVWRFLTNQEVAAACKGSAEESATAILAAASAKAGAEEDLTVTVAKLDA